MASFDISQTHLDYIGDLTTGPHAFFEHWPMESVFFLRILEGRAEVRDRSHKAFSVGPGSFVVLFPGHVISLHLTESSNRIVYFSLRGEGLVRSILRLGFYHCLTARVSFAESFFNRVLNLYKERPEAATDPDVLGFCQLMVSSLAMRLRHEGESIQLFDLICALNTPPYRNFSTKLAAEKAGLARCTLDKIFRRNGLVAPGEYLARLRITLALEALFEGRQTMSEIARELEFSTPSAFTAFFHRRTGMTPTHFKLHSRIK